MNFNKLIKTTICLSAAAVMCLGMAGCGKSSDSSSDTASSSASSQTVAEKTGEFVITLYPKYAPTTCENFEKLVKDGFYDGSTFHRVISQFMAQGGQAPEGKDEAETIKGEFVANGDKTNVISHVGGVVSMARTSDNMDSANSQFFICFSDITEANTNTLNGNYAAFGKVTEGMEVIDDLEGVSVTSSSTGELSAPEKTITINKAEMIEDDENGNHRAKFSITYTPGNTQENSSESVAETEAESKAEESSSEESKTEESSK